MMEVILLERIEKLGQMGDIVRVRDGFARNFLLPQRKALRATEANRLRFDKERIQLEARNLERRQESEGVATRLEGVFAALTRQASEGGQLYGSVTARDIASVVTDAGFTVSRHQVILDRSIKTLGVHPVRVALHPEVSVTVNINIARTADEAAQQEQAFRAGILRAGVPGSTLATADEDELHEAGEFFDSGSTPDEDGEASESTAADTDEPAQD
jgi:large subunit ribosomal protein L9